MTTNHLLVLREWVNRLAATVRRRRRDADLEEELRVHQAFAAEASGRDGAGSEAAARGAAVRVGTVAQALESLRDQRGVPWLEDLSRDLRYAGRTLMRARAFTIAATASLALGIGASSAIFAVMDAVLFRTAPIQQPDRLFFLGHDSGPRLDLSANYPIFERYQAVPAFGGVTAYRPRRFRVRTSTIGAEQVAGQYVSGNYHAVVGAPMAVGRGFASESDRVPAANPVAVIGYDYWRTRFAGRPDIVGQTLTVADRPTTIVGVTARGFYGLEAGEHLEITLPMSAMAVDQPRFFDDNQGWIGMRIVARLGRGVSEDQALASTDAVFQQFIREPANGWAKTVNRDRFRAAALVPAGHGTLSLRTTYARPLWVLLGMAALLLVIACANVAVLFLARSADRRRELAIRLGIGAGRARLVRQLLTESLVLALCGGVAGVLVANWGTSGILSIFTIGPTPAAIDATINGRVLAATLAVVVLTAIGFGLAPAFQSTRVDLAPALKNGTNTLGSASRHTFGKTVVVAQVALALVLATGAALLSRSLHNLRAFDAGFTRQSVLLADIDLAGARLPADRRIGVFTDLLDRLRDLAGVQAASLSVRTPIDSSVQLRRIEVPGFEATPINGVSSNTVTRGYFQTFGLDVIHGRDFSDDDRGDTPPVAVVSKSMARHFFGDGDPIGRTFVLGPDTRQTTIVGVVEDAKHERLRSESPSRMVYLPLSQPTAGPDGRVNAPNELTLSLRTSEDPAAAISGIRTHVSAVSKDAMVFYVRTMEQQIDAVLIPERLLAALSASFAAVALLLSCVGLYGVLAYNVSQRTREIGLRMALGAFPGAILYGVLRESLTVTAIGIAAGVSIVIAAMRLLSTFLFGLTSHDPATLAATVGALLTAALVAGYLPARRAARMNPVAALRD